MCAVLYPVCARVTQKTFVEAMLLVLTNNNIIYSVNLNIIIYIIHLKIYVYSKETQNMLRKRITICE